MNEAPKSIWQKKFTGRAAIFIWSVLAGLAIALAILIASLANWGNPVADSLGEAALWGIVGGALILLLFYVVWPLARLLFWKHWRRTLFGLACFATLIPLFYAEENWRGRRAWENYKHEREAQGEKFDFKFFVPPPVPDEQNFAVAPIWVEAIKATLGPARARAWFGDKFPDNGRTNFTSRLQLQITRQHGGEEPKAGDWQAAEPADLKIWQDYYRATNAANDSRLFTNDFPVSPQLQSPAQDVLLAMSKYAAALEELRVASRLPYAQFPLEYGKEDPASILLPHLALLKMCSQVLRLRAIAELQNGQSELALDDVRLSLRLAESVQKEPIIISHLVRVAMLQLTLQPVWEGLAERRWTDAQLVALETGLAKLDFLANGKFCERGELGFASAELEYLRRTRNPEIFNFTQNNQALDTEKLAVLVYRWCPSGWFYQNHVRYCRFYINNFLPVLDENQRVAFTRLAQRANEAMQKEISPLNAFNYFEAKILPALGNLAVKFARGQSDLNLARTAIALERYRLAHGNFPEALDALAPPFLEKIPHDVIGGQPLKYRRTADGQFILYSVGWNETDDGGAVVFKKDSLTEIDRDKGDWVWRYPAK